MMVNQVNARWSFSYNLARSDHTKKPTVRAREEKSEPRIVRRRPYPGDSHAVSPAIIRRVLSKVPPEYFLGLRLIELLPRPGIVGEPFGQYCPSEKTVLLYSLPMEWEWPDAPEWTLRTMARYGAQTVPTSSGGILVRWDNQSSRILWFILEILAHELGHHYTFQYRRRRKLPTNKWREELLAELHKERICQSISQEKAS